MLRYTVLFTLSLSLLCGCVRDPQDIPPAFTENPVFFVHYNTDGADRDIAAGIGDYVLNTQHATAANGVVQYTAIFVKENCTPPCGPSLEFGFWDYGAVVDAQSGAGLTFTPGEKEFYDRTADTRVHLEFSIQEGVSPLGSAFWAMSGNNLDASQPVIVEAAPDDTVDVCFNSVSAVHPGGETCVASYCFHMQANAPCIGWLKAEKTIGNYVLIEPVMQGTAPYSYSWMNGSTAPFILLSIPNGESRGIRLTTRDAQDCSVSISRTIHMHEGRPELCPANPGFSYHLTQAVFDQFSTVEIIYTDADGQRYTSAHPGLPADAMFEIQKVEPFITSPEGFPTLRLTCRAECTLQRVDGEEQLGLTIEEMVIAVSYDK